MTTKPSKNQSRKLTSKLPANQLPQPDDLQTIYADGILNIGLGPNVSRLTFGIENGDRKFKPSMVLVLPTNRMLEAISAIHGGLLNDPKARQGLIEGLDAMKAMLLKKQ